MAWLPSNRSVAVMVKDIALEREVWGSIPWPVKSDTLSSKTRHFDVSSSCVAQALSCGNGPATRYSATSFSVIPRV